MLAVKNPLPLYFEFVSVLISSHTLCSSYSPYLLSTSSSFFSHNPFAFLLSAFCGFAALLPYFVLLTSSKCLEVLSFWLFGAL